MQDLRELAIIEAFGNLSSERKRVLLEQLIAEAGQTEIKMAFDTEEKATLFEFARKQWPLMSTKFFYRLCERWDFLCKNSYGNCYLSCAEIGDFYLQAKPMKDNGYADFPFENDAHRKRVFYQDVPKECKWEYMFISVVFPGHELCTNYLIKDLMELPEEDYIAKMKEFGFM